MNIDTLKQELGDMLTPAPFIVLSLPRSRSAWMRHFLSYGGNLVGHDISTRCSSVAQFKTELSKLSGTCETGAVLGWRLIREELPAARLVVVKRDPTEVYTSLLKFGIMADMTDLMHKWELLGLVAELPGVLSVEYRDLTSAAACQAIFERCLDLPFDWQWAEELHRTNIQVNMSLRLGELIANRDKLESFKSEVAERTGRLGGHHPCLH